MNKSLLCLGVISVILVSTLTFSYIKYNEIKTLRMELTSSSNDKEYMSKIKESVIEIIDKTTIHKVHKKWIKEFIVKELPNENPEKLMSDLLKKLSYKNINLNGSEQSIMKNEIGLIVLASKDRLNRVKLNKKKYREMGENKLYKLIEEKLIGENLTIEDLNEY